MFAWQGVMSSSSGVASGHARPVHSGGSMTDSAMNPVTPLGFVEDDCLPSPASGSIPFVANNLELHRKDFPRARRLRARRVRVDELQLGGLEATARHGTLGTLKTA